MKIEDAKIGLEVEFYVKGTIIATDPATKQVKIEAPAAQVYSWFDASDVEPINRPSAPMNTWRDYVADAIREGRDAEAVHLIGNKSRGVLPYIQALQELYSEICKRSMYHLTQKERELLAEVTRLANLPPPAICAIGGCTEKGRSRPWERDTRVLCDDHSAQMNLGRE